MKKSLTELFNVSLSELQEHFDIRLQLQWAIDNLNTQLMAVLTSDDCFSLENTEKRTYLGKAINKFQGNLDELNSGSNTALREVKAEKHYEKDLL